MLPFTEGEGGIFIILVALEGKFVIKLIESYNKMLHLFPIKEGFTEVWVNNRHYM